MAIEFTTFRSNQNQTRQGVLAYVRVSSEEQADRRASLEEQRRRIKEHFEGRLGLKILGWYADEGASAYKDDERREQFWAMVERAKNDPRVGIIAVDEESRFYRNRYKASAIKGELLDHGVLVLTVQRTADPRTMVGLWMESIEETMAHAHSLANREYTLRGMAGNVHQRDPKTGWAFKNGGPAPYGWKNKRIDMGRDAKGRPMGRTIWELDPPTADVRRSILLWRKDGWTYEQIRDALNRAGIPSPRGGPWSQSTIVAMLREDMVWTAAGYTVWNKHYRKNKPVGQKWKPSSEWVVEPNAHPAIISEEEARAILAVNNRRRQQHERGVRKDKESPYLIKGDNSGGEPLFVCGVCGARVLPQNPGARSRPRYVCGTKVYKGARYCPTPRVDLTKLERELLDMLGRRFTKEYILGVIGAANRAAVEEPDAPAIDQRQARLDEINRKLERIQRSIMDGADPSLWTAQLNALGQEKAELERSLQEEPPEEAPEEKYRPIGADEAERIADKLVSALESPDVAERRLLLVSLVRQLTLAKDGTVYADLHPDPLNIHAPTLYVARQGVYGNNLVPPTGRVAITTD